MTEVKGYNKRKTVLAILLGINLFLSATSFSQSSLTTGTWTTEDTTVKIQFYQRDAQIYGKITWIKGDQNLKDTNNKEKASRRVRNLVGLDMFKSFESNGESHWKEGSIYDPVQGQTYNATLDLQSPTKLVATGYHTLKLKRRKLILIKSD